MSNVSPNSNNFHMAMSHMSLQILPHLVVLLVVFKLNTPIRGCISSNSGLGPYQKICGSWADNDQNDQNDQTEDVVHELWRVACSPWWTHRVWELLPFLSSHERSNNRQFWFSTRYMIYMIYIYIWLSAILWPFMILKSVLFWNFSKYLWLASKSWLRITTTVVLSRTQSYFTF